MALPHVSVSLSTLNEIEVTQRNGFSKYHFTLRPAVVRSLWCLTVSPWTAACQAPLSLAVLHLSPGSKIHGLLVYKLA